MYDATDGIGRPGPARRRRAVLAALALAAAVMPAAGCNSDAKRSDRAADREPRTLNEPSAADVDTVNLIFDEQSRGAVVSERTIYPYHFAGGGSTLSPLGVQQLRTLAAAARDAGARESQPSRVNVARGEASAELYEARIAEVRARLADAGVAPDQVTLVEEAPGGKGVSTDRVLTIGQDRTARPSGGGRTGGGGSQMGGQTGGAR